MTKITCIFCSLLLCEATWGCVYTNEMTKESNLIEYLYLFKTFISTLFLFVWLVWFILFVFVLYCFWFCLCFVLFSLFGFVLFCYCTQNICIWSRHEKQKTKQKTPTDRLAGKPDWFEGQKTPQSAGNSLGAFTPASSASKLDRQDAQVPPFLSPSCLADLIWRICGGKFLMAGFHTVRTSCRKGNLACWHLLKAFNPS